MAKWLSRHRRWYINFRNVKHRQQQQQVNYNICLSIWKNFFFTTEYSWQFWRLDSRFNKNFVSFLPLKMNWNENVSLVCVCVCVMVFQKKYSIFFHIFNILIDIDILIIIIKSLIYTFDWVNQWIVCVCVCASFDYVWKSFYFSCSSSKICHSFIHSFFVMKWHLYPVCVCVNIKSKVNRRVYVIYWWHVIYMVVVVVVVHFPMFQCWIYMHNLTVLHIWQKKKIDTWPRPFIPFLLLCVCFSVPECNKVPKFQLFNLIYRLESKWQIGVVFLFLIFDF